MASFKAQRQGDVNSAGGSMTSGADSVIINDKKAGIPGISVSAHHRKPVHGSAVTASICQSVIIEGKPAVRIDDVDTCGHVRVGGSDDVLMGE